MDGGDSIVDPEALQVVPELLPKSSAFAVFREARWESSGAYRSGAPVELGIDDHW